MASEIHVNNVGTLFKVTIYDGTTAVDVSTATTKQIIFKKPNGESVTKTALFYTDGSDGIIQYTSVAGDLDVKGVWKIQAFVDMTAGDFYSDWGDFIVYDNL